LIIYIFKKRKRIHNKIDSDKFSSSLITDNKIKIKIKIHLKDGEKEER